MVDFIICLGIIRKTKTIAECLHRFYGECIDKYIRFGFVLKLPPSLLINISYIFSFNCIDYLVEICFLVIYYECPLCHTCCPSQLSLRDDPNYDTLIVFLYSDIDNFEKEVRYTHIFHFTLTKYFILMKSQSIKLCST